MNKWDSDDEKLKWMRVRLAGKAQTAYRRLGDNARSKYDECKGALRRRFHPDSASDLYMVELQVRRKQKDEDCDLEEKAHERLALNQFLSQIDNLPR